MAYKLRCYRGLKGSLLLLLLFIFIFIFFLNSSTEEVNPVNKLYSLAYKVQRDIFRFGKHELSDQHDQHACYLRVIRDF